MRTLAIPHAEIERAMEVARRAVGAASAAALRHWRTAITVDWKADRTPVTAADRDSEAAILKVIREAFPSHAILAEESGAISGDATSRWIIDPIDGTRGFARGGTFWGPMVALEHDGRIVAGAMALPALGETYWAGRGCGAFGPPGRLALSAVDDWAQATFSAGELRALLATPWAEGIRELITTCASTRCYGDVAGAVQLLSGRAEAWIEGVVKLWDLAALKVIVEEAGGAFTDFDGTDTLETGRAVATNGRLHEHVLAVLRRARR